MVKIFEATAPEITELSGDVITGGTIKSFASTGIKDTSDRLSLTVENDRIVVKTANIETIDCGLGIQGDVKIQGSIEAKSASIETFDKGLTVRGDVKVYGILDAGFIRATEILTNQRYEKQFLEFASPTGNSGGTGLMWRGDRTRQLIYLLNPDRFWMSEHVDIPTDKSYLINGVPSLSHDTLGSQIVNSHLQNVGILNSLSVSGEVNINNHIFYNPVSKRLSLGTDSGNALFSVFDYVNNVEVIVDSNEHGHGVVGTHNTKGLDIVTDHQTRINISETGHITLGSEDRDTTITRVYGKLSVGVKNPREQFEVAGNMRMGNRLFSNGNASPTEGSFQTGDIIWNQTPRPGGFVGWICTAAGAPGIWKPFGKIEL